MDENKEGPEIIGAVYSGAGEETGGKKSSFFDDLDTKPAGGDSDPDVIEGEFSLEPSEKNERFWKRWGKAALGFFKREKQQHGSLGEAEIAAQRHAEQEIERPNFNFKTKRWLAGLAAGNITSLGIGVVSAGSPELSMALRGGVGGLGLVGGIWKSYLPWLEVKAGMWAQKKRPGGRLAERARKRIRQFQEEDSPYKHREFTFGMMQGMGTGLVLERVVGAFGVNIPGEIRNQVQENIDLGKLDEAFSSIAVGIGEIVEDVADTAGRVNIPPLKDAQTGELEWISPEAEAVEVSSEAESSEWTGGIPSAEQVNQALDEALKDPSRLVTTDDGAIHLDLDGKDEKDPYDYGVNSDGKSYLWNEDREEYVPFENGPAIELVELEETVASPEPTATATSEPVPTAEAVVGWVPGKVPTAEQLQQAREQGNVSVTNGLVIEIGLAGREVVADVENFNLDGEGDNDYVRFKNYGGAAGALVTRDEDGLHYEFVGVGEGYDEGGEFALQNMRDGQLPTDVEIGNADWKGYFVGTFDDIPGKEGVSGVGKDLNGDGLVDFVELEDGSKAFVEWDEDKSTIEEVRFFQEDGGFEGVAEEVSGGAASGTTGEPVPQDSEIVKDETEIVGELEQPVASEESGEASAEVGEEAEAGAVPVEPIPTAESVGVEPFERGKVWGVEENRDFSVEGESGRLDLSENNGNLTWREDERISGEKVIVHSNRDGFRPEPQTAYLADGLFQDENNTTQGVILDNPVALNLEYDNNDDFFEIYKSEDGVWHADINGDGTYEDLSDVSLKQDENGRWNVNYVVQDGEKKIYDPDEHKWVDAPEEEVEVVEEVVVEENAIAGVSDGKEVEITVKHNDSLTELIAKEGGDPYGKDFTDTIRASRDVLLDDNNGNLEYSEKLLAYLDSNDDALTWREAINNPEVEHDGISVKELFSKGAHWLPEFKPEAPATPADVDPNDIRSQDEWRTEVTVVVGKVEPWEPQDTRMPDEGLLVEENKVADVEIDLNGDGEKAEVYSLTPEKPEQIDVIEDGKQAWVRGVDEDLGEVFGHHHDTDSHEILSGALFGEDQIVGHTSEEIAQEIPVALNLDDSTPEFEMKLIGEEWKIDTDGNGVFDAVAVDVKIGQDDYNRWRVEEANFNDENQKWDYGNNRWVEIAEVEDSVASAATGIGEDVAEGASDGQAAEMFDPEADEYQLQANQSMWWLAERMGEQNGKSAYDNLLDLFKSNEAYFLRSGNPNVDQARGVSEVIKQGGVDLGREMSDKRIFSEWLKDAMRVVGPEKILLPKG